MSGYATCVLRVAACLLNFVLLAQERDLTSLSLEDFLNIEVTSVSKSPQKFSRTAAAVFVITQDDIRRSGALSLPEVLRLAPGVHVARITGATWAIGIRGFNGIYSNKLLVMVDGRTVYNALLSGTLWSDQLLMMEDIERIEVIRGPGGTMWGANAVSGVINIITRNSKDTQGGLAAFSTGSLDTTLNRMRYGGKLSDQATWRTWGQYSMQGQTTFPDNPISLNRWPSGRGGMRVDWNKSPADSILVEGEVSKGSPTVPVITLENQGQGGSEVRNAGSTVGFMMGRWNHTMQSGDETTLQAYYNDNHLNAGIFTATVRTIDLDFHYSHKLTENHTLMAGGGMRSDSIRTNGTPEFYFQPANQNYYIYNAFLQDVWDVVPDKLTLTAGGKVEHYSLAGMALQPTFRAMWSPTPKQGYWAAISQAVRTPAHTDYASRIAIPAGTTLGMPTILEISGSQQFRPEVLRALEFGSRWMIGRNLALDLALFRHWYKDLQNDTLRLDQMSITSFPGLANPVLQIPAIAANGAAGINQGGEIAAHYDIRPDFQLTGSYSSLFAQTILKPGTNPATTFSLPSYTPKHQWQARASWDITHHWTTELAFYRIGELPPHALPGYSRLDFRLARRVGKLAEVSLSGQNLLRPRQREFVGNFVYPSGVIARSVELGVRWNFQ